MEEQKPYQTIIGRKVARSDALETSNRIMADAERERYECNQPGQEPESAVIEQRDRYREALIAVMGASNLRAAWTIAKGALQ